MSTVIRPYGDTTGDGRIQVSFTLPVPFGTEEERALAEGAAAQLAGKMGLDPAMVVHAKAMGPDFTFFIVYGPVRHLVDLAEVTVARREYPLMPAAEINRRIRSAFGREMVVVGGPRFDPAMAAGLGVDRVFGRGTTPREVASYLVHTLAPEPAEPAGAAR